MINKINRKINQINDQIGIEVKLPKMTESMLKLSSVTNFVAGSGLIILGITIDMKSPIFLGGLGIVSSMVMRNEAKKVAITEKK